MSITPKIAMICIHRYAGEEYHIQEEQRNPYKPKITTNQPMEMCDLMAIRESPEEMSQMFTENVCMDFDQLIPALVQLLRRL
jgi:hypothetical protein